MIGPELFLVGEMTHHDDLIGYVKQLHPERGLFGVLSVTVSAKETRIIFPDNLCFVGTLPNQAFFHSMLMINSAEFGFYIIRPEMLPLIRVVPDNEMWEFLLLLDDVAKCWKAGFRQLGDDEDLESYPLVEMEFPENAGSFRIIPGVAEGEV